MSRLTRSNKSKTNSAKKSSHRSRSQRGQSGGQARTLSELVEMREVVVLCGAGGVGKTSCAAALGAMAAIKQGGKVLVLTVDPARRLGTALGIEGLGNVEREVPASMLRELGAEPRGRLFVAMLDMKRSWDDLVHAYAPDEETADEIIANPLYDNITSRFTNANEYIAMERLYELHQSGKYDLIIIDTPPTRSALDFIEAPQRMAEFFGGRLIKVLTMPYRAGGRVGSLALDLAARPFYKIAERVLGSAFMRELGEFFMYFASMNKGFVERAKEVDRLLHDHRTMFAVVSTLDPAELREAEFFCDKLAEYDYDIEALILNRVLPAFLLDAEAERVVEKLAKPQEAVGELAEQVPSAVDDGERIENVLKTIAGNYANFSTMARREAYLRSTLTSNPIVPDLIVSVPLIAQDISDLAGLLTVGDHLFGSDVPGGYTAS